MPPMDPNDKSPWKSINHFSALPYGWIPDDSVEFFTQFIFNLERRWLDSCDLAKEHLATCVSYPTLLPALYVSQALFNGFKMQRFDQLRERGKSSELIHRLAENAQTWAELRNVLRDQGHTARQFAIEHCHRYYGDKGLKDVREVVDGFIANTFLTSWIKQ